MQLCKAQHGGWAVKGCDKVHATALTAVAPRRRGLTSRIGATTAAAIALVGGLMPLVGGAAVSPAAAAAPPPPPSIGTIGGPGHATMYPSGLDVDPSGNLYIADTANDQVAAYDSSGTQLWRVGSRGALPKSPGRFAQPRDIAWGAGGTLAKGVLYVADLGNNRVQVLNASDGSVALVWPYRFQSAIGISVGTGVLADGSSGPIVLVADNIANAIRIFSTTGGGLTPVRSIQTPVGGGTSLNGPRDAATDPNGNYIYVADYANDRVVEYDSTGTFVFSWGSRGTAHGQFNRPYGVAVDAAGLVYVADSDNGRIEVFQVQQGASASATYQMTYGNPSGNKEFGLRRVAVGTGPSPKVYAADLWSYEVNRFGVNPTTAELTYGGTPPPLGGFNEPYGFEADAAGNVYVADTDNQRVEVFQPGLTSGSYQFQLAWGSRGFGDGNPGFNWPRDLTFNQTTNTVWVADTKNSRLTEFNPQGQPTGRSLGSVGNGANQMHWPYGITSSGADLVVADTDNSRIQLWDPAAGRRVWQTTTPLNFPKDVSVVGNTVYVADSLNKRIVRLNVADGSLIDSFGTSKLQRPEGVAVGPNGFVWVADPAVNKLSEFDPTSGTVIKSFGKTGSSTGQFSNPTHLEIVVVGSVTELFVMDTWNDRVQIFDVTGS